MEASTTSQGSSDAAAVLAVDIGFKARSVQDQAGIASHAAISSAATACRPADAREATSNGIGAGIITSTRPHSNRCVHSFSRGVSRRQQTRRARRGTYERRRLYSSSGADADRETRSPHPKRCYAHG